MSPDNVTPTPARQPARPRCPECDAEIRDPSSAHCWMCHEPLQGRLHAGEDLLGRIRRPESKGESLAWAAVGVLGVLILAGLASAGAHGILILVLVAALPALLRTVAVASRRGAPKGEAGTLVTFMASLGMVVALGVAAGAAFFSACFGFCVVAMGSGKYNPAGGHQFLGVLGAFVGFFASVGFIVWYFAYRKRKG